ncbi:MAG: histidinol-phosphate transaminase [Halieaceae bacterium]|nr:MAG: histidinol-phosphate transaminase [Halieaceae bacterium]
MNRFWIDKISSLKPYVPGEQPTSDTLIKLNTNEHALPPAESVLAVLKSASGEALRRYPDPTASALRSVISAAESVPPDHIFVGNGSDEVLAHLWFALLKGRRVQTLDTTYGFYPVWAGLYDADLAEVPVLADFSVDVDALKNDDAAIVLANPNAPTGRALKPDHIASLVDSIHDRLVVVDEAYFGFGAETAVPLVADHDNLIVTRSLSKSHALAGMRVGYAIAQPGLIEGLNRVKDSFNSYPLDAIAQAVAAAAIQDKQWLMDASQQVREVREVMIAGLQTIGFEVLPSQANFIFTEHQSLGGKQIFDALRARDILVRRWDKQRIENWLRISVGTMAQAERLLLVMREIVSTETG